jgi:hypothetical protein
MSQYLRSVAEKGVFAWGASKQHAIMACQQDHAERPQAMRLHFMLINMHICKLLLINTWVTSKLDRCDGWRPAERTHKRNCTLGMFEVHARDAYL